MTVNVALLDQVMAHIEANPHDWEQGDYRCSTGMCFAGWAVELSGGTWVTDRDSRWRDQVFAEPDDEYSYASTLDGKTEVTDADYRAQRVLGIGGDEAGDLFYAGNTMDEIRRIVKEIKENAA